MSSILTSAPPSPSLVSFGSSRASSPLDSAELELPAVQSNINLEVKGTRHPQYYFKDGNVVFLIEEVLYNVHRYFFERDSTHFRSILESAQRSDEHNPIVLPDIRCADFDEFLAILYPTSAKWGFESIQLLAIDKLTATAIPVDKIVLGRRYGISDWLPGAYEAVCTRADPLTVEEGMKLGVEDIIRISAVRQVYGCAEARYETKHLSEDLGDIFGLEKPVEVSVGVEENAIKSLEQQVVTVQAEFAAFPTPTQTRCLHYNHPYTCISRCGHINDYCTSCQPRKESDERRLKREDKEDKEKRLKDLKEKQRGLVEKQERISLFR
ncbi:hypothetical protein FIBSPDRAFT_859569 [Athelia psychrophila]|uniref:BTB domain-containing protein n=1 Tax=Athelia psychrophila TaxID=1759441 RepID=A0A166L2W8_9AGAM|nr:hypothetical protein FIBSPDRAFT_859569 [Fibularhizoctonia sp. CBS 109695]